MLAVITALIIVAGFGSALLLYFHYEDKKEAFR